MESSSIPPHADVSFPIIFQIDNETCQVQRRDTTVITNVYEGIPETLLLNFICWILLILLFAVLRNRAWDYGRLALVHTEKWTQLFYKNTDDAVAVEESSAEVSLIPDSGCMWFPGIFKITRDRIYQRCGPDALHYLSFQLHLLILYAIITVTSIGVVLPVNFQGMLEGNKTTFGHTTLSNLGPSSNLLWVHVTAALLLAPLTIFIMRKSSGGVHTSTALASRTLMITHISKAHRNVEDIKNYFLVRYPQVTVTDVQIAYKVKKLAQLEQEHAKVREAKLYCESNFQKGNIQVQPHGCVACCRCKTVDALEYYTREEQRLSELISAERQHALSSPLGIAFVTVQSNEMAEYVITSFQPGSLRHWLIAKAPSPGDINWDNLQISYRNWYSKAIVINAILFLVLFFLTTPVIFVNIFNNLTTGRDGNVIQKISPLLSEFLPTLLLLSMSAIMPVIVAYSDQWMSHWTKSKQNHATMFKIFIFLLFMVLILPSLGLTSAQAFVEWSLQRKNQTMRWKCIFLADKGAFFVNYIITSAFIGTALELLRFPELAMYAWRLVRIKSEAEKTSIRKEILSEFPFGIHYAWTLLNFTVSTVFSLTCPLITPFGLVYLCLKHLVDKYNIYYVYRPITMTGEGQRVHGDAVKMVRVAVLLTQLILAAFFFVRESGGINLMTFIMLIGLLGSCMIFFLVSPFPTCRGHPQGHHLPERQEKYIAPVLLSTNNMNSNPGRTSPTIYGTSGSDSVSIPEFGSSSA